MSDIRQLGESEVLITPEMVRRALDHAQGNISSDELLRQIERHRCSPQGQAERQRAELLARRARAQDPERHSGARVPKL